MLSKVVYAIKGLIMFFLKALLAIFKYLFEVLENGFNGNPPKKEGYDSDFLKESELLSSFNKGFNLTGTKSLTEQKSHQHSLIIGSSGTGKSTVVIIPTIYSMAKHGHSLCINDPSGELYQASAGYLNKIGYSIKVLHFNNPEISDGYNPLERIVSTSDIYKTATTLVQNSLGKSGTDAFWNAQSISFIALMIAILKKQNKQYQNVVNIKYLVDSFQADPEIVDRIVANCNDQKILKEYKNFLLTEKKVMANIISTCRSALMLFSDTSISRITSIDTINFEEFRSNPTALFIMNKTSDLMYYSPLTSTFFLQFFNHIMNQPIPNKKSRSIFFLIDEMSSLYLPTTLQIALSNLRKYRCGIMGIIQDCNQLEHLYGRNEAHSIISNCFAKIYFPGQPIETARELESMLGKREYVDKEDKKHTRALLTSDEIRTMENKNALIFCGSHKAIFANMIPYFNRYRYSNYSKIEIPNMNRNIIPHGEVPLIHL
jgi:type IV secretion system protein VirD4